MFPRWSFLRSSAVSFPHAGGDVSRVGFAAITSCSFSPRRWGCFQGHSQHRRRGEVFPTQVGMFPTLGTPLVDAQRFPHAGGDVSLPRSLITSSVWFSPRRWGCFPEGEAHATAPAVFPTQVGMFLKVKEEIVASNCYAIERVLHDIAQVFTTN